MKERVGSLKAKEDVVSYAKYKCIVELLREGESRIPES